ncbi:MAG: class I tRNA ligase family protein, partial [Candidatus Nanoarchaeia archaeon]
MLKLYNTLTRKKGVFKPLDKKGKAVKVYTCGPTVYWYQHIGNLRSYLNWDILKRVLLWNNYSVKHVMNVTDVGHLTSDEDEGEDKVEKEAKKEKKSAKEITDFYLNVFKQDLKKLNILEPDVMPRATEHIKEQINLIKILEEKGYTYQTDDGIYFDTSKFKDYGKLSRKKVEDLEAGKRIDMKDKKHKTDFALWKFSQENRQQEWDSPWGVGFPGWHIECSAMSSK